MIIFGRSASGLARVAAGGGVLESLTTLDATAKEAAHVHPRFLPDGRRFLYVAQPGGVVYLASLDDARRTRVAEFESTVHFSAGHMLFLRQTTLFAQPFDPSSGTLSGDALPVAENVGSTPSSLGGRIGLFSASDTGTLVFERDAEEPGGMPVWVDRSGRETGPALQGVDNARFPRLSPDGRRLALIIRQDVWVADLQGQPPIRLTSDGARAPYFSPLWTPDGTRIVYESQSELRSLPSDGSGGTPVVVSPNGHFHPHGWSEDGKHLVAVDFARDPDIVTISTDGKLEQQDVVANADVNEGGLGAAVSPDGHWLAYNSNSTGRQEVWVRPFPGPGAAVRLSPNGGTEPVWSRDGREIFYLERDKMMMVAVKGGATPEYGAPVLLFERAYVGSGIQPPSFAVAPDGRFIMLKEAASETTTSDSLTVVLNWMAELRRRMNR